MHHKMFYAECRIEAEGRLKVTDGHMYCISDMAQDTLLLRTTNRK